MTPNSVPPTERHSAPGSAALRDLEHASALTAWCPEQWRPIPGYEGRYDVSDQGRVRSWVPYRSSPLPRLKAQYASCTSVPYPAVSLMDACGANRPWRVHELVLLAFVGPRPDDAEEIRHLDGDHNNNHLSNLRYGTRIENAADAMRHGRNKEARKTHCPQGHEYTTENTAFSQRGNGRLFRKCRACYYATGPRPIATHCKRGHEFTPENTLVTRSQPRRCRACRNDLARARYAEQRGAVA